jgi:hypothetical protein
MPEKDLEGEVRSVWQDTVDKINEGVELSYVPSKKGGKVTNDFIGIGDKRIISIRPHASKASYLANNSNADELPVPAKWTNKPVGYSGNWMTKQCFWLNNGYIYLQIEDLVDVENKSRNS